MRTNRIAVTLLMIAGLAACAAEKDAAVTMPDVAGKKLDVAYDLIKDAGYDDKDKIKIEGGGVFGVVVESNWTICEQSPASGATVEAPPSLTVERSCDDDETPEAAPTDEPTPEITPEGSPSTGPSTKTLTPKNNADLKAMLAVDDYCDEAIATFANQYAGRTIAFNGSVVNTDGGFNVAPGDEGPDTVVGPVIKVAGIAGSEGDRFRFVVEVGRFNADQCTLFATDVSSSPR